MLTESAIQAVVADILDREGGYTDNPADRGGPTAYGITQDTANEYGLGDVRNLTRDQAGAAYVRMFHDWGIDAILDVHVFGLTADACVQHGPGNGIRWLQMALGTSPDGVCGPLTQKLSQADINPRSTYYSILATRMRFYGHIIAKNHSQAEFAYGWMNRLSEFVYPVPQWT